MRLIDADALPSRALEEKRFVFTMHDRIKNEYIVETVYKDLADFINEAPTIDAVPVVRCKDCKHYSYEPSIHRYECNIFNGAYEFIGYPTNPDDFCSYGERKDNHETD